MSWNATSPVGETFSIEDVVDSVTLTSSSWEGVKEIEEALEAGKAAARSILESGAVGDGGKQYRVSINGHANPDHEPQDGWVNDFITVSIYQG